MTDEEYMQAALSLAEKAEKKNEVPIGCVIVKNGKIIAKAYNKKERKKNPLYHAEMAAINKAVKKTGNWRLNDCTLYVTLEPCPMCAGAIVNARIGRVVFGAYERKSGSAVSKFNILTDSGLNHETQFSGGISEEKCVNILQRYFAAKRKKK